MTKWVLLIPLMKANTKKLPAFQLSSGEAVIEVDPRYFRPTEVEMLLGDPTKAKENLGWEPEYDLDLLVKDMLSSDLKSEQT